MEVEMFAICDAATQQGGRLNILGVFDRISARQFPATHPQCSIALRMRFDKIEEGDHRVRISFVNADGKPVMPGMDGNIPVKFGDKGETLCANMVLNVHGLKFETPGKYALDLAIDGRHEKSLPVNVILVQPKPQQPAAGDSQ